MNQRKGEEMQTEGKSDVAQGLDEPKLTWLPILMYHRVTPSTALADPYHLGVSVEEFEAQTRFLKEHGYRAISFEELAESLTRGEKLGPKRVIITFDDGYRDTYLYAFPILKKYQFTATIFLVGYCLGGFNAWDQGKVEQVALLDLRELQEMVQYGISVGSHSMTHSPLDHLDTQAALEEIVRSKAELEETLGVEVHSFSFPHGSSTPILRAMVREAGYLAACGTEQRAHTLFNLSRIDVAQCRGTGLWWRWKLSGLYHHLRQNTVLRKMKAITRAARRSGVPMMAGRARRHRWLPKQR